MKHLARTFLGGAILAIPLFTTGCYYETYPHYRHYSSSSYYDDDDYYRRDTNYRVRAGGVWIPGHWRGGVWIRGHWE
jgi:hypothetical protein